MSDLALKPCPFCGRTPILICNKYRSDDISFQVQCNSKGRGSWDDDFCPVIPSTFEHSTDKDAIRAWNTRAQKEATDDEM